MYNFVLTNENYERLIGNLAHSEWTWSDHTLKKKYDMKKYVVALSQDWAKLATKKNVSLMPINLIFTIAHNFSLSFSKPYKMLRFFSYCCCCSISLFLKLVSETQMLNDFYRVLIFHISNDFNALQKKNALKHSSGVAVTLDQTIFAHLICKTNNDGLFK